MTRKVYLLTELVLLFFAVPCAFYLLGPESVRIIIPVLMVIALYCLWQLLRDRAVDSASLFSLEVLGRQLKPIILRFVIGGLCLSGIVYLTAPDKFLALPKSNLELWFAIILLYPLLSVLPQELIYRTFLFQRYSSLIRGNPIHMIIMSAVLFSLAHLVFNNWQALVLTAIGGLMLAYTYHRSKSVICVSFEHAIWGNLSFTIGLGEYFSGGTIANMFISL